MSSEKQLLNQVALVTGGSRGIGRAVCVELARQGAYVAINYRGGEDAANETLRICTEIGGQGEVCQFDVADSAAVTKYVDDLVARKGKLDILVNNAGISRDGLFVRMKDEDLQQTIATNLNGSFYAARIAAKYMMKARQGRIVNMSSVVGQAGNAGQASYVSSKAAVIGLTKSLALELASRNICVNAIAPGFIETDMTGALSEKQKTEHLGHIPLGSFGTPEDIAHAVVFLVSPGARYITGQVLGINGGMYM
jgi:3-oxoacyl-[acyl-carrier protein] reductase